MKFSKVAYTILFVINTMKFLENREVFIRGEIMHDFKSVEVHSKNIHILFCDKI